MFHLFVAQNATYSAKIGGGTIADFNEVNLLAAGAVCFFDMTGTKMTTTTTLTGQNQFYCALGSGDATKGARVSVIMPRDIQTKSTKTYTAAVKQVDIIGKGATVGALNLPATLIPGTIASILVVDGNTPVNNIVVKKYRYEYTVKVGDTDVEVVNGLVAAINANTESLVVAAATGTPVDGITLTAKANNQAFVTSVGYTGATDILGSATVQTGTDADATAIVYSCGAPNDIRAIEQQWSTTEGNTNQIWLATQYWKVASLIDSSSTYDTVDLQFDLTHETPVNRYPGTRQNVMFALVNGSAQATSIKTIIGILFAPTTLV